MESYHWAAGDSVPGFERAVVVVAERLDVVSERRVAGVEDAAGTVNLVAFLDSFVPAPSDSSAIAPGRLDTLHDPGLEPDRRSGLGFRPVAPDDDDDVVVVVVVVVAWNPSDR